MTDDKKRRKADLKAGKKEAKAALKRAKAEGERGDAAETPRDGGLRHLLGRGLFQLIVKIAAGLIVAYILIRLGMNRP